MISYSGSYNKMIALKGKGLCFELESSDTNEGQSPAFAAGFAKRHRPYWPPTTPSIPTSFYKSGLAKVNLLNSFHLQKFSIDPQGHGRHRWYISFSDGVSVRPHPKQTNDRLCRRAWWVTLNLLDLFLSVILLCASFLR